jgi:hypothetical protein
MRPMLNLETPKEIDMIQIDAKTETQNSNVLELKTPSYIRDCLVVCCWLVVLLSF